MTKRSLSPSWLKFAAASLVLLSAVYACGQADQLAAPRKAETRRRLCPGCGCSSCPGRDCRDDREAAGSRSGLLSSCDGQLLRGGCRRAGPSRTGDAGNRRVQAGAERRPNLRSSEQRVCGTIFPRQENRDTNLARAGSSRAAQRHRSPQATGEHLSASLGEGRTPCPLLVSSAGAGHRRVREDRRATAQSVEDRLVLGQLYTVKHEGKRRKTNSRPPRRSSRTQRKWY